MSHKVQRKRRLPFYKNTSEQIPFSGNLDGNGYSIYGANISLVTKNKVGLFSYCAGSHVYPSIIENLILNSPF